MPVELFIGGHNILNLAVQPIFSLPQNPFTFFMLLWLSYYNAESFVRGFADMVNNVYCPLLVFYVSHSFPESSQTGQRWFTTNDFIFDETLMQQYLVWWEWLQFWVSSYCASQRFLIRKMHCILPSPSFYLEQCQTHRWFGCCSGIGTCNGARSSYSVRKRCLHDNVMQWAGCIWPMGHRLCMPAKSY